jgi:predicted nucleic acid-binding protein
MNPVRGTGRLKAVLDTNIYIGAFAYPQGRNSAVWNAAVDGRYELVVSPAIIRETAKVLRRDFAWRDDRVQRAIRVVAETAFSNARWMARWTSLSRTTLTFLI